MNQLFYAPGLSTGQLVLPEEESFHLLKVMRVKKGDTLEITDGKGNYALAIVSETGKKEVTVRITEIKTAKKRPQYLHIAIAPTKNIDRFEWFIEKATEIGVEEITPLICQRSERKEIKHERSKKVLIAAMKQSKQYFLPQLNEAVSFKEFIDKQHKGVLCIAHCSEVEKKDFADYGRNKNCTIMIGPEGDFTATEIELAKQKNAVAVSLGGNRLRTETAGIFAAVNFAAGRGDGRF